MAEAQSANRDSVDPHPPREELIIWPLEKPDNPNHENFRQLRVHQGQGRYSIIMYYPDGSNWEVSFPSQQLIL
ncbi:hypothetical protein CCHL11_08423 [Colletotrichum chlorophyti]|uniref:Uncharacterized protein n=1 Tax=Colletotrichum chlorophyti TaxID=708187 RepID=A0A1Q8RF05_9PEZI|nr:hypothetical protein CCHL11_08423 [Colletotrichum chlorophyti]